MYVKARLETCIERDPKGLYKKAQKGEIKEFTGISSAYEQPQNPEIVIDTDKTTVQDAVKRIFDFLAVETNNHSSNEK